MRRTGSILALSALFGGGLVACSPAPDVEEEVVVETVVVEVTEDASADDTPAEETATTEPINRIGDLDLRELYAGVLRNPAAYPPNPNAQFRPKGTYSYAIVEATGDNSPDMLLKVDSYEFGPVMLMTVDPETGGVKASTDNLVWGAASAGGSRGSIAGARNGFGLYEQDWGSTHQTGNAQLYVLEGTKLVKSGPRFEFTVANRDSGEFVPLTWFDSKDLSGLDHIETVAAGEYSPAPANAPAASPAAPVPQSQHNINRGQVGGNCGTTSNGDRITAGNATSCEFAAAIYDAALATTFVIRPNPNATVTAVPKASITAYSPVTGQAYNLDCLIGSAQTQFSCEQPGDRSVRAMFSRPMDGSGRGFMGHVKIVDETSG